VREHPEGVVGAWARLGVKLDPLGPLRLRDDALDRAVREVGHRHTDSGRKRGRIHGVVVVL
jgi:hypothetical protein